MRVPIALTVGGRGTFEGADCLWANPNTVFCGIGKRTNGRALSRYGISFISRESVAFRCRFLRPCSICLAAFRSFLQDGHWSEVT